MTGGKLQNKTYEFLFRSIAFLFANLKLLFVCLSNKTRKQKTYSPQRTLGMTQLLNNISLTSFYPPPLPHLSIQKPAEHGTNSPNM